MDDAIRFGLALLVINDGYLLRHDVNERSITHKLGECYALTFPGWDVDCEFNKNLNGPKRIEINPEKFLNQMADFLDEKTSKESIKADHSILRDQKVGIEDVLYLKEQLRDPENLVYDEELDLIAFVLRLNDGKKVTKPIFPDIIVHKRGTRQNMIVIEVKKTSNRNRLSRLYDLVKLNVLTNDLDYAYDHAYFIDVPTKSSFKSSVRFDIHPYKFNPRIKLIKPT